MIIKHLPYLGRKKVTVVIIGFVLMTVDDIGDIAKWFPVDAENIAVIIGRIFNFKQ